MEDLREALRQKVILPTLPAELVDENTLLYINPTGRFVTGGPAGDSGLTGRKLLADTYGSAARHGGGSISGKDPTKMDRTGAYLARYLAKNIVAAGLAERCEVQLAYAIGLADPVSVAVDTCGTGTVRDEVLAGWLEENVDNAVKYADSEGKIKVSLTNAAGIKLEVYNTCEHISKDSVKHLFDRFYRAEQSHNSQTGGYGIGLSVAKAVAEAHRGKISAYTADEKSLRITVLLMK